MPGYKTHIAGGLISSIALVIITKYFYTMKIYQDPLLLGWYLMCGILGSLFPDIDTKSKGQPIFYLLIAIVASVAFLTKKWSALALILFMALLPLITPHRGITHQFWFIILVPFSAPLITLVPASNFTVSVYLGSLFFTVGALSHLILDFGPRGFYRRGLFGSKGR